MKYIVKSDRSNYEEILEEVRKETLVFRTKLKTFGYVADYCFFDENCRLQMEVYADGSCCYQPRLYAGCKCTSNELRFEVQTISYGALNVDEYKKFLDCCKSALSAIDFLSSYDYSKFPIVEFEK